MSVAEKLVQEVMSKLAPSVSVAPVSFDRLLIDIHKFNAENLSTTSTVNRDGVSVPFIAPTNSIEGHTISKEASMIGDEKHPNLVPVLGAYKGEGVLYLIFPRAPFSVESILHFSPSALVTDDCIRLLLFEMLAGLAHCHDLGIYHGNLRPWNILVLNTTWCWVAGFGNASRNSRLPQQTDEPKDITIRDNSVKNNKSQAVCNRDRSRSGT